MKVFRLTGHTPVEALWPKPNNDLPFISNPPIDKLGFADSYLGQNSDVHDKKKES